MGKLGRRMFGNLRGVTTQEKKAVDYYRRGYTDGIAGVIMPLDYTTATPEDIKEYARGYADGMAKR